MKESQSALQQSRTDAAILRTAVESIVRVFNGGKITEDGRYKPNLEALSPAISSIPIITVSDSSNDNSGAVDAYKMEVSWCVKDGKKLIERPRSNGLRKHVLKEVY